MLLTLAVLLIGGTVLLTGPVQAVVVNFSQTGTRTATDSLLCPNKTYTFHCEISGDSLQLTSFDINGSAVDIFFVFSETATEGKTINQTDFNFTGFNSANGSPVAASAVMDSSTGLSSVKLECRDLSDDDLTSLSTVVKYPLDGPNPDHLLVTCVVINDNVMFIKVRWDPVECAQLYVLNISDIDSITTNQTSHQSSYSGSATNISVRLLVVGGSALLLSEECIDLSIPTSTTPAPTTCTSTPTPNPPTLPGVCGIDAIPVYERNCCGETETGYNISFINFPAGERAYYVTADGSVVDLTITDGDVATIYIDSTVTVNAFYENGTVYDSQELAPSVSGQHSCCMWIILVIVLFVILCCLLCAIAIVIIVKKCFGEPEVANQASE